MNDAFWNGLFDTRWEDAPLGMEAIRLARWLRQRGTSERTYRVYAHAVVHLGRILQESQGEICATTLDETVVSDFVYQHLPVCRCYRQPPGHCSEPVRRGLHQLLAMLREEGVIAGPFVPQPVYLELLEGYSQHLRRDRGLAENTVHCYRRYVRDFLGSRGEAVRPDELTRLTADDLLAFGRQRAADQGASAWKNLASSLSHFYRWLALRGHGGRHLIGALPPRRHYRLANVPCALSREQVQRLLSVVDRHQRNGRRNYAMLLLAATYGLRSCEVQALKVDDINWSDEEFHVFSSKTGHRHRLPLTRSVGEAILDYLREERPDSRHREVFLSSAPPHGPMRSKINQWLSRCYDKAGIETPRRGTHTLRHSLAIHMLRDGATLKTIGDVLGHRSPDTTVIYTKLHVDDLRSVALEPEVVS